MYIVFVLFSTFCYSLLLQSADCKWKHRNVLGLSKRARWQSVSQSVGESVRGGT